MPQGQSTGARLRARRLDLGLGQAELAARAGISGSYLNLIEHGRRRIGGKLLHTLARALAVDPALLAEGAESALLVQVRAAADAAPAARAEIAKSEDFAARFPGWAALVAAQARRIAELEGRVQALTDRLAHDPQLATSLHEVLSAATSIRSTASILVGDDSLDADWQRRFSRNVYDDSQRLAEASRALVGYLDAPKEVGSGALSPIEEVEAFFEAEGWHLPDLEAGTVPDGGIGACLERFAARAHSAGGLRLARRAFERYAEDARHLPLDPFAGAAAEQGWDPARLAARFAAPLAVVLRRLAFLPDAEGKPPMGLALCDGAGALTLTRPVTALALPRGGAACPLWPLFSALGQLGRPLHRTVVLPGDPAQRFACYAVAEARGPVPFDAPPVVESVMLIVADPPPGGAAQPVGIGCRICPREGCAARREPSILTGALT